MKQLKAVIFDVDGTLAETEHDGHRSAFNRAFKQAGLDWFWDEQRYGELLAVTGGKKRLFYYLLQSLHTPDEKQKIKVQVDAIHRLKTRFYTEACQSGELTLRPGVARLLEECRQSGLKLAIATTTTPANLTALIEANLGRQATDWFKVIAAGDVVKHKKPAGDIYVYCLQQLGLNAAECIAIEDSENGLRAALSAGLVTLVTPSHYSRDQDFSGAACVVDCFGDDDQPCCWQSGLQVGPLVTVESLKEIHDKAYQ